MTIEYSYLKKTKAITSRWLMSFSFALLFVACDSDPDIPETSLSVNVEASAFLSVAGTSPDDVWVVGAQTAALEPPVVLHWDGKAWDSIETGQLHDMWWVHAFKDGPTFVGGGGATVLKIEDKVVERVLKTLGKRTLLFRVLGSYPEQGLKQS